MGIELPIGHRNLTVESAAIERHERALAREQLAIIHRLETSGDRQPDDIGDATWQYYIDTPKREWNEYVRSVSEKAWGGIVDMTPRPPLPELEDDETFERKWRNANRASPQQIWENERRAYIEALEEREKVKEQKRRLEEESIYGRHFG
jgi:hypothetical protein